tara:strand:+ start:834 stop:1352 length:519 start_codon:yes stop_codon:yes gene_type:complete
MTDAALTAAVQDGFWQTAEALMFHHTNPWELDEALTEWGYAMGPCEAQDLLGLDKVLARRPLCVVPILPRMVAEGRMGKGGGVGYYRYPGGGGAVIDPLIEDLILEEAWFAGAKRSDLSDAALVDRMHRALGDLCRSVMAAGAARPALQDALQNGLHMDKGRVGAFMELIGP